MASQRGKDMLLKFWDGVSFVTVAGLRSKRIGFNAQTVDITDSQSAGRWRELLDGAGIQRASVSASGVFKDAASDELVRQTFFDGAVTAIQLVIPDFGTIEGGFQITALDYAGSHDGEVTFDIALESGSALTFGVL
jgi:TP901-1 family phage major tail protein